MLLEDILLAVAVGVVLMIVGVPIARSLKGVSWRRKDPLAEAHERLRIAKLEAEAARVNREAEKIYEHLYDDTLSDDSGAAGTRVAPEPNVAQVHEEPTEKGKKHGQ
jgi:hypothetical protein